MGTIHPPPWPTTEQACYNCNSGSTAGAAAAGVVVGMAVGAAAASSKASSESSSAYNAGLLSRHGQREHCQRQRCGCRTLMRRRPTPMLLLRMLMPPLPMRMSLRAPPTSRIRWAQFMGRYLPAASVPRSREVEPTICAATRGSARPTVRTGSSIAWCRHRKEECFAEPQTIPLRIGADQGEFS